MIGSHDDDRRDLRVLIDLKNPLVSSSASNAKQKGRKRDRERIGRGRGDEQRLFGRLLSRTSCLSPCST